MCLSCRTLEEVGLGWGWCRCGCGCGCDDDDDDDDDDYGGEWWRGAGVGAAAGVYVVHLAGLAWIHTYGITFIQIRSDRFELPQPPTPLHV